MQQAIEVIRQHPELAANLIPGSLRVWVRKDGTLFRKYFAQEGFKRELAERVTIEMVHAAVARWAGKNQLKYQRFDYHLIDIYHSNGARFAHSYVQRYTSATPIELLAALVLAEKEVIGMCPKCGEKMEDQDHVCDPILALSYQLKVQRVLSENKWLRVRVKELEANLKQESSNHNNTFRRSQEEVIALHKREAAIRAEERERVKQQAWEVCKQERDSGLIRSGFAAADVCMDRIRALGEEDA